MDDQPLRAESLGLKLGLVLFLLVAGAMAIVYVAVVPRLESRLVDTTFDELEQASAAAAELIATPTIQSVPGGCRTFLDSQVNARVAVLERAQRHDRSCWSRTRAPRRRRISSTTRSRSRRPARTRLRRGARSAMAASSPRSHGRSAGDVRPARLGPARRPAVGGRRRSARPPHLRRRRAGRVVARRRSGRAASSPGGSGGSRSRPSGSRAGTSSAPVVDDGQDEVAELARSFDRMRVRLAHLDGARREFIANASHELRTPLFALGGFLELLADEDLDEATRRDFLETARGQVDRLTRLATDLLDLSRLDADQLGLRVRAGRPGRDGRRRSRRSSARSPRRRARHARSPWRSDVLGARRCRARAPDRPLARRERASAHARRYDGGAARGDLGRPRGALRARRRPRDRREAEQERVFERFYRGEGSAPEGSGIGLAIARELAQRMGGDDRAALGARRARRLPSCCRGPAVAPFSRENVLVLEP